MNRFTFRLERVLRLRELAKREAEAALALAYAIVRKLQEEAGELNSQADRGSEELNAACLGEAGVTGEYVGRAGRRIAALRDAEGRVRAKLGLVLEELSRRKLEFVERKRALEVLEKLRGKRRREWIVEVEREEQSRLDETHRALANAKRWKTRSI